MTQHPPERIDLAALSLRRATEADAERIAATVAANLRHLAPWMPWASRVAGTPDAQPVRLRETTAAWDAGREYEFLVLSVPDDELLGIFELHRRVGPGAIELGYWLAEAAVGHGHATTAAKALTDVALALPDVDHVEIRCDAANMRSQRVPERLGYRLDRIEADDLEAPAEIGQSMVWCAS